MTASILCTESSIFSPKPFLLASRGRWVVTKGVGITAMRNTYLVCYDICEDRRLRLVYRTMRDFGDHLQYSIFECQFTPTDLARCRHALSEIIDHREDQVLFVDLGPVEGRGDRVITALGKAYSPIDSPCIVVDRRSGE